MCTNTISVYTIFMRSLETRTGFPFFHEQQRDLTGFPDYLLEHIKEKDDLVRVSETIYGRAKKIKEQLEDAPKKSRTLLLVSGLSGAGKDTIVWRLIEKDPRFGWAKTCTTRPRRVEENDDNDTYFRLTVEEFMRAVQNDSDVIETNEFSGNYYCSLMSSFAKGFAEHEIPILRPDPTGGRFYQDIWRKNEKIFADVNLVYVFVVAPSLMDLRSRLEKRKETPEVVDGRMAKNISQLHFVDDAEYIAVNPTDELDKVVDDIIELMRAAK